MENLQNKTITVLGAGESGMSAVRFLHTLGCDVRCSSIRPIPTKFKELFRKISIPFEEGHHSARFLEPSEIIVMSPGIKPTHFVVDYCHQRRMQLLSEVELASLYAEGPWCAITGTNGKTTVSTLLANILRKSRDCDLCGNIGKAFTRSLLERPRSQTRVVEMSSFQLHYSKKLNPQFGLAYEPG